MSHTASGCNSKRISSDSASGVAVSDVGEEMTLVPQVKESSFKSKFSVKKTLNHSKGTDQGLAVNDDPVKLYLREMGRVPLLDRKGEVTLAQAIDQGKRKIKSAVFESLFSYKLLLEEKDRIENENLAIEDFVDADLSDWKGDYQGQREKSA